MSISGRDGQLTADPQPAQATDQIIEGQAQRQHFFNHREQVGDWGLASIN